MIMSRVNTCARVLLCVAMCAWSVTAQASYREWSVHDDFTVSPDQNHLPRVSGWDPVALPAPLSPCEQLKSIYLVEPVVRELPPRWAACPKLFIFIASGAKNLKRLPVEFLFNTTDLEEFSFTGGALDELPSDLFNYSPKLNDIFARCAALIRIDLNDNKLEASVLDAFTAPALQQGLRELRLANNPTLGELCHSPQDVSKLSPLRNLTELSLKSNNIKNVCRDWRTQMTRLKDLKLCFNPITQLARADLEFVRDVESTVDMFGAPITKVALTESDYRGEWSRLSPAAVSILLNYFPDIPCDCGMYWTWRALRDGRWPASAARVERLRCLDAGWKELDRVSEHESKCAPQCSALPSGCWCQERYSSSGVRHLRVSCAGAGFTAVPPQLRALTDPVHLVLANNTIEQLQLDQLPPHLIELDLRNTSLSSLPPATARSLLQSVGRVHLASNPWSCSCHSRDTLAVFREHVASVPDYPLLACAGGPLLQATDIDTLCSPS